MKVTIDDDNCIASGACVLECPEVFDQDEAGMVLLRTDHPDHSLEEATRAAAAACPAAVIFIDDKD